MGHVSEQEGRDQTLPEPRPQGRALRLAKQMLLVLGALALLIVLILAPARPLPKPYLEHAPDPAEPMDVFVNQKLELSRAEGVRPGNEERFVQRVKGKAPAAILYVHGFGSSRAEGEAVVEDVAQTLSANVYYTRLPGHGGGKDAHLAAPYEAYLQRLEEAFHATRPQGEKLILMASSTGGLLGLWLASRHPQDVSAVVLASPLFELADPMAFLLSRSVGMPLIELLYGKERDASWKSDPEQRKQPGYEDHWLTRQHFRALLVVDDFRRTLATTEMLSQVTSPVLLMYYYADPEHQDKVLSVAAMRAGFQKLNGGHPHPLSREVAIEDGNHILMSAYVRTDKAKILAETKRFLTEALGK